MSLKIRLARIGKRNAPTYKVVVSETRDKRNGKFIDIIGHFNPLVTPQEIEISEEKIKSWKAKGAQTTPAVDKLVEGTYVYTKYAPKRAKGGDARKGATGSATKEATVAPKAEAPKEKAQEN